MAVDRTVLYLQDQNQLDLIENHWDLSLIQLNKVNILCILLKKHHLHMWANTNSKIKIKKATMSRLEKEIVSRLNLKVKLLDVVHPRNKEIKEWRERNLPGKTDIIEMR